MKKSSRIYCVAHLKGGSGKTSTAINMAIMLAEMGRKVIFVDADVKGAHGTRLLKRRSENKRPDQPEILFTQLRSKKHLLEIIESAEAEGTDVVVDTNPTVSEIFVSALTLAHVGIHPIRQGHTELDSLPNFMELLEMIRPIRRDAGLGKLKSRTLVTDYSPTKQGRLIRESLEAMDEMLYVGEIPHSEKFGEALLQGQAVWEVTKHHKHTGQIREVILACIER